MKESERLANALIKRKNLVELFNSIGIKRIGFESLDLFEKKFGEDILKLGLRLKQEMEVKGKRVLEREDVKKVIDDLDKEEEIDY